MVQGLHAKNSLLNSKVEHQARLLKSLTAKQPESGELLSTVDKLNNENNEMKSQLERQSELLPQFQAHFPGDSSTGALLKKLIQENVGLTTELEQKQDQLESLSVNGSAEDMLANVDQLQDENIELKSRLEANQSLAKLLTACSKKDQQSAVVEQALQNENQRLRQLLEGKKHQIEVLSGEPTSRPFVQTITRLKEENRQLCKISEQKAGYATQLLAEKKQVQAKLRQYLALAKEAKKLRADLEFQKKLVASYRKVEYDHEVLKRKYHEACRKRDIAINENTVLNKKLKRLAVEYNALVRGYENLFGKN